ncbi:MAG: FAD-dependent oxidoreductase [Clostridia bacterium]|nr:FAD-dependent oxidoreductase [Clostridia bacterium]
MRANLKSVLEPGKLFKFDRKYVAHINSANCVNCGTCREICPGGAIEEKQREICRICPDCTDRPAMAVDEMKEFTTKQACTTGCPLGISPQGYIGLCRVDKPEKALEVIWRKNPLPSVCGRICHHPCEQLCKRGVLVDEPISIRATKRYLSDNVELQVEKYPKVYEEKIAVIGAGPAGLTAAHYLLLQGYDVTVFEESDTPGGMMYRAIPEFRLAREALLKDIRRLEDLGMDIQYGVSVDKAMAEKLVKEYDAVVVAAGRKSGRTLTCEGADKANIVTALDFLDGINNVDKVSAPFENVVVIGGGDVAMDCARAAKRLGAKNVTAYCMETGSDVPGHPWEIEEAEAEGVTLNPGFAPVAFPGKGKKVSAVTLCNCKSSRDADGRIRFDLDKETTTTVDADQVILAIGQIADPMWDVFDNNDKVYFAGDIRSPVCSVVDGMASGKAAAHAIDTKLQGRELKNPLDLRVLNAAPIEEKIYPALRLRVDRPGMPLQEPDVRVTNFEPVEGEYDPSVIKAEAWRCLRCGYMELDVNKCIGCGVCMESCPKGDAITMVAI